MEPTYIPPSPPVLLCPTMLIPRKLTVSMLSDTVIMLRDIVLSVILLNDEVRDIGGSLCRRRLCGLRRSMAEIISHEITTQTATTNKKPVTKAVCENIFSIIEIEV